MSIQQQINNLKKTYGTGNVAAAEVFVKLLRIKKTDKLYASAVEWAAIRIQSNSDLLSSRDAKIFSTDNKNKKLGVVHRKIIKEVEQLYKINEVMKGITLPSKSQLSERIPTNPLPNPNPGKIIKPEVKLESNVGRVEKGGSVVLNWTSKNAIKIKRSNIPGITTKTPVNGFIEVGDIKRRRNFYIVVQSSHGETAESKVTTLVETEQYKKEQQNKVPPDQTPQKTDNLYSRQRTATRLVSPTVKEKVNDVIQKEDSIKKMTSLDNGILLSIEKSLTSILKILKNQLKLNQDIFNRDRKLSEDERRLKREVYMEESKGDSSLSKMKKGAEEMLSPFKTIIDKIVNFIFYTFLGRAFNEILNWVNDPENKDKVNAMGRFLKDFWPLIAGAALYFLTPLGGFINGTIKLLTGATKLMINLVPKMLNLAKLVMTNPYLAALAAGTIGSIARVKEKERLKPILEKKESEIKKELEDKNTPWYKKLGLFFAQQETSKFTSKSQQILPTYQPGSLFANGGNIFSGSVTEKDGKRVSGAGKDTQLFPIMGGGMAVLQPGETVLQPGVREKIISEKGIDVLAYNKGVNANKPTSISGNMIAMNTGGVVSSKGLNADQMRFIQKAISRGITNQKELSAFMSQVHVEQGGNFSRPRKEKYNSHSSDPKGKPGYHYFSGYANPDLGLGNRNNDDAYNYRGRGYLQLTGRANYADIGKRIGVDLLKNPDLLVKDKNISMDAAIEYWKRSVRPNVKNWNDVFEVSRSVNNPSASSPSEINHYQERSDRFRFYSTLPPSVFKPKKPPITKEKSKNPIEKIQEGLGNFIKGFTGEKRSGLINSNSGQSLPYSQDNIFMRAEKGEYVIPSIAVNKIGIGVLDKISSLDPNFKITRADIPIPKPLSLAASNNTPITLPPINAGTSGNMNTSGDGSGTKIPSFSATPSRGMDDRLAMANIYGIV